MRKLKRAINNKLPEEDVEYTFVFPGKRFITYVFVGVNDKGRVVLMNVNTKKFTNMTPGYFSYLRRNQLITKRQLGTEEKTTNISVNVKSNIGAIIKKESYEESIIKKLKTLTPAQEFSVQAVIGRSALSLAKDLEDLYKNPDTKTQEYVNRIFSELLRALDVCEKLEGKESNNLFSSVSF